jgi:DNA-binding beta-propeller fold protein YncE
VHVADTRTMRWVGTIAVGGSPREMTFDPSGRSLVVANEAGWVDVVHPLHGIA